MPGKDFDVGANPTSIVLDITSPLGLTLYEGLNEFLANNSMVHERRSAGASARTRCTQATYLDGVVDRLGLAT